MQVKDSLACENSRPSSLPARVAFREMPLGPGAKTDGCFRRLKTPMMCSKLFFDVLKLILDFHLFCPKAFREAIKLAVKYKENSTDFMDEVLRELEVLADKIHFNTVLLEHS